MMKDNMKKKPQFGMGQIVGLGEPIQKLEFNKNK